MHALLYDITGVLGLICYVCIFYVLDNIISKIKIYGLKGVYDRMMSMDFSEALKCCKEGKNITRLEWKNKDKFVTYVSTHDIDGVALNPCFLISTKYDFNPWIPSNEDLMAEDWIMV